MSFSRRITGKNKNLLLSGYLLALIGIIVNEWVLAAVFGINSGITNLANHLMFALLNLPLIIIGIFLIIKSHTTDNDKLYHYTKNISLIILSIVICLMLIEFLLRLGYFSEEDNPFPVFIPYKFKKVNLAINQQNIALSRRHPFGFNDQVRPEAKPAGVFRIAILGDSFVWGDGLPYEDIWSHKLEHKITQVYGTRVEILSWGRRGWSTLDQLVFLREKGVRYHPDLLIISFTVNDPDLGNHPQRYFKLTMVPLIWPLRALLPNAVDFFSEHVEALVNRYSVTLGYQNWENRLYSPENLARYAQLLERLAAFCASQGIRLLFVLTPCYHDPGHPQKLAAIIPLLQQAQIEYLNLYPALEEKLRHYPARDLWANRANPHPGALQTEIYATVVFDYLKAHYLK